MCVVNTFRLLNKKVNNPKTFYNKIQLTTCNGGLTDARSSLGALHANLTQGPKLSRTGPAVTGCQQLQEERLRGALDYEEDAAHFTLS